MKKHTEDFKQEAVRIALSRRRVGRLMRINGVRPVRTRKHKVAANSNHSLGIVANLLDGNFVADVPNRKWAGDISYVWTAEGWLYLAVIIGLHSRCVVGRAVSDRMRRILRSGHWIWLQTYDSRQKDISFIQTAAVNIAPMIIKRSCRPMACGHLCLQRSYPLHLVRPSIGWTLITSGGNLRGHVTKATTSKICLVNLKR